METSSPLYNGVSYGTPSTICCSTGSLPLICELFGAPIGSMDNSHCWWDADAGWTNWGKDYYVGDVTNYEMGSVDVYSSDDGGMDQIMVTPTTTDLCLSQTNVISIECGATDFCVSSYGPCATDLDCCQTKGIHMFCHPKWGYCVNTV